MRPFWAVSMALSLFLACSGGDPEAVDRVDRLGDYDNCLREELDGCLVVNYDARGKGPSHMNLIQRGKPVNQYGISPSIHMGAGDGFARPLRAGVYDLFIFRKPATPSKDDPTCRTTVRIRARTAHFCKARYTDDGGCRVGPGGAGNA